MIAIRVGMSLFHWPGSAATGVSALPAVFQVTLLLAMKAKCGYLCLERQCSIWCI